MKKKLLFVLFVLCNVYAFTAQENAWFKIKDMDGAYIIEFPSEPVKGENDVVTDQGTVKMNTYTLQSTNDKTLVYMTSFTKYPESFFKNGLDTQELQDTVLGNSVNGAVTNTNGELISDKKITLNGYRGRNVKIELEGGYIINMKLVLVGYKLYLVQVIYEKIDDDNETSKRFFESLELINVKE